MTAPKEELAPSMLGLKSSASHNEAPSMPLTIGAFVFCTMLLKVAVYVPYEKVRKRRHAPPRSDERGVRDR